MSNGIYCRVDNVWLGEEDLISIEPLNRYLMEGIPISRKTLKRLGTETYLESLAGNMYCISWREFRDMRMAGRCEMIYDTWEEQIAACAAFRIYLSCIEIGPVVTCRGYRGQGMAIDLVARLLPKAAAFGEPVVTLANMQSSTIFLKLGFAERSKSDMPADLLAGCEGCPQFGQYPACRCRFMVYEGN